MLRCHNLKGKFQELGRDAIALGISPETIHILLENLVFFDAIVIDAFIQKTDIYLNFITDVVEADISLPLIAVVPFPSDFVESVKRTDIALVAQNIPLIESTLRAAIESSREGLK